jgi:hypothetical protein
MLEIKICLPNGYVESEVNFFIQNNYINLEFDEDCPETTHKKALLRLFCVIMDLVKYVKSRNFATANYIFLHYFPVLLVNRKQIM